MLLVHQIYFSEAADKFGCCIIVRPSNVASMKYVADPHYVAKPLSCKAKTADNTSHALGGLVVDVEAVPDAYGEQGRAKARELWKKFAYQQLLLRGRGGHYSVVTAEGEAHRYCVTYQGKLIHTDYDLLAVVPMVNQLPDPVSKDTKPRRRRTDGATNWVSPLVERVQKYVNERIGKEMVRHGADFDAPQIRASGEMCHYFGPGQPHRRMNYHAPSQVAHS